MGELPLFDTTLEYDNKKLGLMLGVSEGMKMWRTRYARSLAPQYFIGEASLASLPPEQELALSQIEWHAGFGQRDFSDERKYFSSNGVDPSVRGVLMPAPLVIDAEISGGIIDIDIGAAATDRDSSLPQNYTFIALDNPANGNGVINSVEIWAYANMSGCKVGTFYGTAPNFTCRDYATIGSVTEGSKQTFSGLSIEVEAGDYIGIYFTIGYWEVDTSGGAGIYSKTGDQFDAGQQTYTGPSADYVGSLYGEGTTEVLDGTPVGMVEFKDGFYIAAGEKLYKWNTTTNVLNVVWAGVSKTITDIDVHGDYIFIALGGSNKYYLMALTHKQDDTTNTATSPDATDQGSLETLLNEIKADYNAHRVSTTFHDAADSTNVVDAADASDLATSITLANQIKAKFNSHRSQAGVHPNSDALHDVTSTDATDLETCKTLANEEKADYNAHLLAFGEAVPDESKADYFGKNQDLLWKVIKPNEAKSATNPSYEANPWGTANNMGDASRDITEAAAYAGEIHFGKEDGLWKIDSSGVITDLLPDFKFVPQATNFKNMVPWRGYMYLPVGDNTLYEFDGSTPFSIGPSIYSPRDFMYAGRITALAADTEWLYILSKPTGANTKAILLKTRIETIEGDTDYRIHPLEELDFAEVNCAFISTLQGDNRRLWFGGTYSSSPKVAYIVLPKFYSCPWEDSAYQVCQSGSIESSYFSANFPNTIKALFSFSLSTENLSRGHRTVKVEYQFEGDADYTVLASLKDSPSETKLFKSGTYGKKVRFRLTLETDDVSQIPRVTEMLATARLESAALKEYDFTARCVDHVTLNDGKTKDKKTMAKILKEFDVLRNRGCPFRLYDYLTGEAIDVDFVSPTPELAVIQAEPTGKTEVGIHIVALRARTE